MPTRLFLVACGVCGCVSVCCVGCVVCGLWVRVRVCVNYSGEESIAWRVGAHRRVRGRREMGCGLGTPPPKKNRQISRIVSPPITRPHPRLCTSTEKRHQNANNTTPYLLQHRGGGETRERDARLLLESLLLLELLQVRLVVLVVLLSLCVCVCEERETE